MYNLTNSNFFPLCNLCDIIGVTINIFKINSGHI
jgi:hypothetical protein